MPIPERLALAIPPRLVEDGTAAGRQIVVVALAPLQVAIPERLVGDGTATGHQIVVMAVVATAVTVATVVQTIAALDADIKILLRLR